MPRGVSLQDDFRSENYLISPKVRSRRHISIIPICDCWTLIILICSYISVYSSLEAFHFKNLAAGLYSHSAKRELVRSATVFGDNVWLVVWVKVDPRDVGWGWGLSSWQQKTFFMELSFCMEALPCWMNKGAAKRLLQYWRHNMVQNVI